VELVTIVDNRDICHVNVPQVLLQVVVVVAGSRAVVMGRLVHVIIVDNRDICHVSVLRVPLQVAVVVVVLWVVVVELLVHATTVVNPVTLHVTVMNPGRVAVAVVVEVEVVDSEAQSAVASDSNEEDVTTVVNQDIWHVSVHNLALNPEHETVTNAINPDILLGTAQAHNYFNSKKGKGRENKNE
jgi:hypothetical protein